MPLWVQWVVTSLWSWKIIIGFAQFPSSLVPVCAIVASFSHVHIRMLANLSFLTWDDKFTMAEWPAVAQLLLLADPWHNCSSRWTSWGTGSFGLKCRNRIRLSNSWSRGHPIWRLNPLGVLPLYCTHEVGHLKAIQQTKKLASCLAQAPDNVAC
jgi:hypothetical protein